jgi:hypothetical protein
LDVVQKPPPQPIQTNIPDADDHRRGVGHKIYPGISLPRILGSGKSPCLILPEPPPFNPKKKNHTATGFNKITSADLPQKHHVEIFPPGKAQVLSVEF